MPGYCDSDWVLPPSQRPTEPPPVRKGRMTGGYAPKRDQRKTDGWETESNQTAADHLPESSKVPLTPSTQQERVMRPPPEWLFKNLRKKPEPTSPLQSGQPSQCFTAVQSLLQAPEEAQPLVQVANPCRQYRDC